jgi:STE24 endopeptidase
VNEDKAARYHRLKRQVSVVSLAWAVLFLAGLQWSGLSLLLRTSAEAVALGVVSPPWEPEVTVLVYVLLLTLLNELATLPLGLYGTFILERRYGLSKERLRGWLRDRCKSFALYLGLAWMGVSLIYFFIRFSPDHWWLGAAAVFALIVVGLTNLTPVLLLPMFYSVKPLDRESLRVRLIALAERAGARVLGAYELGLGDKTKKANAALAGIGGTRRIFVSDTMLAVYSEDEIEVVLAHELAHHVHGDIWKGVAFEIALIAAGFFLASRVLAALADAAGLRGAGDVAGLPMLLLASGTVSLVMVPVAHALSRAYERSADRFALNLTKNPSAFISAMRRLGAQNLAEDDPSKVVQWLFYTHPPLRERIAAAQAFKA